MKRLIYLFTCISLLCSVIIENKDFFEKDKEGYYHVRIVARRGEIVKLMNDIKTVYAFLEGKE